MAKISVAGATQEVTSLAVNAGDDVRMTIRGISKETQAKVKKAAHSAGKSNGAWVTDAIDAKFAAERPGLPAVIAAPAGAVAPAAPSVTRLVPTVEHTGMVIETDHLAVLAAMIPFTGSQMGEPVRQEADKVIVDRLRLLRVPKPRRQTKGDNRLPEPPPNG